MDQKKYKVEYQLMRELGFSKTAIACYESLCEEGPTIVGLLAKRLHKQRTGLYRELKQLERKGFIISLKTDLGPTYFYNVPVEEALERLADYQYQILRPLINKQALSKSGTNHRRRHR